MGETELHNAAQKVTNLIAPMLDAKIQEIIILTCAIIGILYGFLNAYLVLRIKIGGKGEVYDEEDPINNQIPARQLSEMEEISRLIREGANTFLITQYKTIGIFAILFGVLIALVVEPERGQFWVTGAFALGAITSIASGYIGMWISVRTNVRCTKVCHNSLADGFLVAFRGGSVLGFTLVGLALLNLAILIIAYKSYFLGQGPSAKGRGYEEMFEAIAGYGLGGSAIALFGRVGGGIYTKAADVGADLVGKVIEDLDEDSIMNPGTIADNVGDNVGDIAGMGADLFGSLAESSCACLVISASSPELISQNGYYFPLLISALGIIVCVLTTLLALFFRASDKDRVMLSLNLQLLVSTVVMTPVLYVSSLAFLPATFTLTKAGLTVKNHEAFYCCALGLWAGYVIGYTTNYYTSGQYAPVQKLAKSCVQSAATNIIQGISLGFYSTAIPITCIALTIFFSFAVGDMYGIALAALGMLSTIPIGLAIDGYGPISDNAGGIAEMSQLENARTNTDILDEAGNTTAAIGKGFAIGSACLVALALFGAFATETGLVVVNILKPLEFAGLIFGAMLPYYFTAQTMGAVGDAANEMIIEIKRQFDQNPLILQGLAKPDYQRCIQISTNASLREMMAPGLLVIASPLVFGFLLGPRGVSGLLAGAIVSGVQIAISFSNTGGAWDNAKKYIEAGHLIVNGVRSQKRTEAHKNAIVGDTVGDPMKDTSGPSINILIKLMAITSLVFGNAFIKHGGLLLPYIKN